LPHVAGAVDLAGVVYALDDGDARGGGDGVSAELACGFGVGGTGEVGVGWSVGGGPWAGTGDLDGCDLEVVLGLAGGVGAEEEAVSGVWFVRGTVGG
jgi:hypothetical protein